MQRVPKSEKRGRRHSSIVTVVNLKVSNKPTRERFIPASEVRTDVYRDSGPGGQHRNTTDSAVRLTHEPTGIVVTAVEERSQTLNREVAWKRLQAALDRHESAAAHAAENATRSGHFTAGERTWNWCGWRDEVKSPDGRRGSMIAALGGNLSGVLA